MKDMIAPIPTTKKELDKYYVVRFRGKVKSYLSTSLAARQKVSTSDLNKIKNIHRKLLKIFEKIEKETDEFILHLLADKITELDYELQEAWNFERNENFHTWWFNSPKCMCPRMDNMDRLGTKWKVRNGDCPLHGVMDKLEASSLEKENK